MGAIEDMEKRLAKNPSSNGLRAKLEQLRKEHARTTPTVPPPPPLVSAPDVSSMNAKDAIVFIKQIDEYIDLQTALTQEKKREKGMRSTVIDAINTAEESFE